MTRARAPFFPPIACALVLPFAACAAAPIDRAAAEGALREQAAKWNAGDLPGFVATYRDGPELTFLGARGLVRGRQDLLATYERGYPTAAARGRLAFEVLDFRPLGADHALLLGRYAIDRPPPADGDAGFFTLVLERRSDGVAILHDHTSAAAVAPASR